MQCVSSDIISLAPFSANCCLTYKESYVGTLIARAIKERQTSNTTSNPSVLCPINHFMVVDFE